VVGSGCWREHVLWAAGGRVHANCERLPVAAEALAEFCPEAVALAESGGGELLYSILAPGTTLLPHCGPSNNRLTLHLGLVVPRECSITVAGETRSWREGQCLCFDDSFEHSVTHAGREPRVVLMLNFPHPDLKQSDLDDSLARFDESTRRY